MARAEQIGRGQCPVCKSTRARFAVSKNGLCCMTCEACHLQAFARGDTSDRHLRDLITSRAGDHEPAPQDPPKPTPAPTPAPAPEPKRGGLFAGLLG